MPIEDAYRDDLAYIHDVGHGSLAEDAARRLQAELGRAGHLDGTVVDLGCGSGILARQLVEAGYDVVGMDVSAAMVALARTRVPGAQFHVRSFVAADLPSSCAVTAIGEVFNYCFDAGNDDRALAELFRRAYASLVPGGLLLFDIAGRERANADGPNRTFTEGPDWAVLVKTDADSARNVLTRRVTSFRQVGSLYRKDVEVHQLRLLDPADILENLHAVGFDARAIPGYGADPLPSGVTAFLCWKPVGPAV